MIFRPKEIYEHKILEKYKINIEETNRLYREKGTTISGERLYCEKIGDCDKYIFYSYRTYSDGSGGYIIRQEKSNSKKVVFFGKNTAFKIIYKDYLFQVDRNGEIGRFGITARNVDTGNLIKFNWLSERAIFIAPFGYGRFLSQDKVNNVFIDGEKLIFKVSRSKSNDPYHQYETDKYDIATDYDLIVEDQAGKFIATSVFPFENELPSSKISSTKTLASNPSITSILQDDLSNSDEEYIKYIMSNNPTVTRSDVVAFLSILDIYDKTGSKGQTLDAFDSFIYQLANANPMHAMMVNGFFCGLLGSNMSLSKVEIDTLAKKNTPLIISKLNSQIKTK